MLDNDFYAWTQSYLAWRYFPDLEVRYAFRNRSLAVPIGEQLNSQCDFREELEKIRSLSFTADELAWLSKLGLFSEGYLEFLQDLTLPPLEIVLVEGWLKIEYEDRWATAKFWESPLLATVSELYFNIPVSDEERRDILFEGERRLQRKIEVLKDHPDIKLLEFGTRRRFSTFWQNYVLTELASEIPNQLLGTSNPWFAMAHDLVPSGTMAHELVMILGAQYVAHGISRDPLRDAQEHVLELWEDLYGDYEQGKLLVALTDTFSTPYFLSNFSKERASKWTGFRQDSGEPIEIGERMLEFYLKNDIDPMEHFILFSDALDINKMLSILYHFEGRIPVKFACGTHLTNDLGVNPLNIVVKPKSVHGHDCVKLSDDLSKSTGSKDSINRYKELVSYGKL